MEIKAKLNKPYTVSQKMDFIVQQNHKNGYEIRETDEALEAWGYTDEEKQAQEQERIQALFMTRSDFFDGMIKAFGVDGDSLLIVVESILNTLPVTDIEKKVAINNYKNALNFYRKHTLFTLLSNVEIPLTQELRVVITSEQWDKFFDEATKKNPDAYKELLPKD